jgi:ParB family chromosome partitioning protein
MTTIVTIPLARLVPSPVNVRKTGGASIEDLAASIAAHGLMQNLQVRPNGEKYEVVAGGRRLAALKWLAKQRKLPKGYEVPCRVLEDGDNPTEISLAENIIRQAMHPADQFDAWKALADAGKSVEDIAARFGVTLGTVTQRLKLASVSPKLMAVYREDEMKLEQLMAFTVSDNHAAQEAAWFDVPPYDRAAYAIKRRLTHAHIATTDRRARFVGLDAYEAAGGAILRDLFAQENEGWLTDPALLDRLVSERLEREAEAVRAEGWRWVEIMHEIDYGALQKFRRVHPSHAELTPEQDAALTALGEEYDALVESADDEALATLESIEAKIDALKALQLAWKPEDMARAGAVVSIGYQGVHPAALQKYTLARCTPY